MMEQLETIDRWLLVALNGNGNHLFADGAMWTMTHTATWALLFLSMLYVLFKNNVLRKTLAILLFLCLLVLCVDQLSAHVVKPYFHRLRPTHDAELSALVHVVNGYRAGLYGFVSNHAANTFAVAVFLSLLLRRWWMSGLLFLWAALCSYTRIYLGVHFPGDILCGVLLGILAGVLFYKMWRMVDKRMFPTRDYFSDKYTSTGYLVEDLHLVPLAFAVTMVYVACRAVLYAASF